MPNFNAEIAAASPTNTLKLPLHVFLGEALDVARFIGRRWSPVRQYGRITTPGLDSVSQRLPRATGDDMVALVGLAQQAQTDYLLAANPNLSQDTLHRAQFIENEIEATLEFLFDDGVEDDQDAQLAALKSSEAAKSNALDALGLRLGQYAALAQKHRADVDGLGDFDVRFIDEAAVLSKELLALPPPSGDLKARAKLEHRNRVLNVLAGRVGNARSCARFVFRQFPEIAKEATSSYERRKRAARRAAPTPS